MRATGLGVVASLSLLACGSGNVPSGGSDFEVPEGDDDIVRLSTMTGEVGTLFQAGTTHDGHLYTCTAGSGLYVARIDGADELTPVVQGAAIPDGRGCSAATVSPDGLVFLAGQSTSQPGSWIGWLAGRPEGDVTFVGTGTVGSGIVEEIAVTETHVYAAAGQSGVVVFERQADALVEVGRLTDGIEQALGVATWTDGRLLVANALGGLLLADVSDPAAPALLDSFDVLGSARRVRVHGDYAFVAGVNSGVSAVDLTTGERAGKWTTYGSSLDIALHTPEEGTPLLYVANWEDLVALDVSDPAHLRFAGSERVDTSDGNEPRLVSVATAGSLAFAIEWSNVVGLGFAPEREAADIRLHRWRIDFGLISIRKGKGIRVENHGEETLEITGLTIDNDAFEVSMDEQTIEPGEQALLQIEIVPDGDDEVGGTLTITTNDPDEGSIEVPLVANRMSGMQVGATFDTGLVYRELKTGNDVTIAGAHPGKAVLLAYFATWCGACATELSDLQREWEEHGNQKMAIIPVAQGESVEQINTFKQSYGLTFDVWDDSNHHWNGLAPPGMNSFPTNIIIAPDGTVTYLVSGYVFGEPFAELQKAAQ